MTGDIKLLFFIMQLSTVNSKCIKHTRKSVNAISTKYQVHFGINHAISVLISTLVNIMFAIFKE